MSDRNEKEKSRLLRLFGRAKKTYPASFSEEPETEDDPSMVDVYAGPEPVEPVLEGVYMGPPVTEEEAPMAAAEVKEVPDAENDPKKQMRRDKGPRMEALYAAPRRPETGRMMLVYAGPDYFANRGKMQTPMAPVYAGPDFFANRGNSQKPAAPGDAESGPSASRQDPQAQAEDGSFIVCPVCGERVPRGGRFCMTCGARLPRDEEGGRII